MSDRPLDGWPDVAAATWPAAAQAGELLAALGADVHPDPSAAGALVTSGGLVCGRPASAAQDWAASGAMAVTGRRDGPPLHSTGTPATLARAAALALELLSAESARVRVDGAALLGQRAVLRGLQRSGAQSAGGAARLLPAGDGWFALNLPRADDIDMLPALVGGAVSVDPWEAIGRWALDREVADIERRAGVLGLGVGVLAAPAQPVASEPVRAPWHLRRFAGPAGAARPEPLRVINLGSLWAAPLAAQLLHLGGATVVDVESPGRPDGARLGTPDFYRCLHEGHHREVFELRTRAGIRGLRELVDSADVIIAASRPRALAQLGMTPGDFGTERDRVWVRITGHGDDDRVAFGDDAAVGGGLVGWDEAGPVFAGDAIADPLTGLVAALTATACLRSGGSWQVELSMREVAAFTLRHGGSADRQEGTAGQAVSPEGS